MKLVYEENEIARLEEAYNKLKEMNRTVLFNDDPDRLYALTFKVTNPSLADYILLNLLHDKLEDMDLGIDIQSIEFGVLPNRDDIRAKLHNMIDEIL